MNANNRHFVVTTINGSKRKQILLTYIVVVRTAQMESLYPVQIDRKNWMKMLMVGEDSTMSLSLSTESDHMWTIGTSKHLYFVIIGAKYTLFIIFSSSHNHSRPTPQIMKEHSNLH